MKKIAIITGASTGIGRATAIVFSKADYKVGLVGRNLVGLEETARLVTEVGGEPSIFECDLRSAASIYGLSKAIDSRLVLHSVDALVNVAGVWHDEERSFANTSLEAQDTAGIVETANVGLVGTVLMCKYMIPLMYNGGSIVNMSCQFDHEFEGIGWVPYYAVCKAIEAFTLALSAELTTSNICVNCVAPSYVASEAGKRWFPEETSGEEVLFPEDVAAEIFRLATTENLTSEVRIMKYHEE